MWIVGCLKNSRASILVNGSPTSEFELFKGLRQGDPMSPFLFILAMEGLHAMVSKAVNTGLFKGASIGHGNINVSCLLYANDAIFVGEWSYSNAYNLICLLSCFYMVSGLKINVHKNKLSGVNVPDEDVSNMSLVLGCGVAKLPMMYLGVPVGCNMGRCDYWKRIAKKAHLVKWETCLSSKAMGGLGIGKINGIDSGIGSNRDGNSTHSPWYCIVQSLSKLQVKGIDLLALCTRSIGDGHLISFWNERWYRDRTFKEMFPRFYAWDVSKSCTVAQRIHIKDWPSVFRRPPRGGAKSIQLDDLLDIICHVSLSDSVDGWKWELDISGFSVSSAKSYIDDHTLLGSFTSTRWLRCIPIKVNTFIWKLRLDKLPTLANLDKIGIDVSSLLCPVCTAHVENVDNLFFSCGMAEDLWALLARWCALDIPEVSNIVEWYSWLAYAHVSKQARSILEGIVSTMLWYIWNFCNAWIFSMIKPKKANI
ncbi:RNA-directed DNA polymerase, eukaryota, reverse transcriptase zinc-binding domain protein [Tanacetum coccineum]